MSNDTYAGGELELFARAQHWKDYWISRLRPYIGSSVLEVGAGIGANTLLLRTGAESRWVCLEPDPQLAGRAEEAIAEAGMNGGTDVPGGARCTAEVRIGTVGSLEPEEFFDTMKKRQKRVADRRDRF